MLGKNIKMLMPEAIAIQHDGYLTRYRKTGVKHIGHDVKEGADKTGDAVK